LTIAFEHVYFLPTQIFNVQIVGVFEGMGSIVLTPVGEGKKGARRVIIGGYVVFFSNYEMRTKKSTAGFILVQVYMTRLW
jgi:hypothetical protein